MTSVVNALSELLFERDAVTVPGLGTFSCDYQSAKVNVVTNRFEQPSATIRFNPQLREENDQLAALLAARDGITPEEARQQLMRFVADCYATLKDGKAVELPGIGTLTASGGQYPLFEPAQSNFNADAFGLCDIHPEPVFGGRQDDRKTHAAVPEDLGDEVRFNRQHRLRWLRVLLWILFLLFAVLLCLFFLDVIKWPFSNKPKPVSPSVATVPMPDSTMQAQLVSYFPIPSVETKETDTITSDTITSDTTAIEIIETEVKEPLPVTTASGTAILPYENLQPYSLIAGCFSQQANAENYLKPILEQGHQGAFLMQKGMMYYVCYGQYATMEEAKAAMGFVKSDPNNKAWILTK